MMRAIVGLVALVVCGCGDDDSGGHTYDAAVDSMVAIDAVVAAGPHSHYVIDSVTLPTTTAQARALGFDLNSDGTVENQFGMVAATFYSMGFDVQPQMDQSIDRGEAIDLVDFQTASFSNAEVSGFTTLIGANPSPAACTSSADTLCRHHLDGTAHFDLAHPPADVPLLGPIVNGTYVGGPGHLTTKLSMLGTAPLELTLIGARARVSAATSTTITTGALGGAVTKTDLDTKVVPAMQVSFSATVAHDCNMLTSPPGCGCVQGSQGKSLLGLFDTAPQNCAISVDEIANNSLIVSLLAPDVTVDGQQALSIGVGFKAVGATFAVPGQ